MHLRIKKTLQPTSKEKLKVNYFLKHVPDDNDHKRPFAGKNSSKDKTVSIQGFIHLHLQWF